MAVIRDESFSRSVMALCLGTAALLLVTQGREAFSQALKWGQVSAISSPKPLSPLSGAVAPEPGAVATHRLVVDLSDRRLYLYQNQQLKTSYALAVGQPGWETPRGSFKVFQMQPHPVWKHPITGTVIPPGPNNPLGSRWIGFWSDGRTLVGFHGTNQETLIGQAVSHGCLRMRNQDIIALYDQIALGTTVTVQP